MITNHDVKIVTFRDIVEAKLVEQFPGYLRKLDENSIIEVAEEDREKLSGYLELAFLMNGQNRLSSSTYYPRGLLYKDQSGIFGVGVFFRSEKWEPCIHIISPRGVNWQRAVDSFSQKVWEHLPEAEIFIRHTFLTRCDKFQPQKRLTSTDA